MPFKKLSLKLTRISHQIITSICQILTPPPSKSSSANPPKTSHPQLQPSPPQSTANPQPANINQQPILLSKEAK